jgi:hypothetical protein
MQLTRLARRSCGAGRNGALTSRRRRIGLYIAAALISLVATEIGLRLFAPDLGWLMRLFEKTDDPRPYVLKPNAKVEYGGLGSRLGRTILWQINDQGLRDDRTIGPHSNRFRVITYGDSQAFGWSVTLDETFQRRMEAIDGRVEVLNLGIPGYNIADSNEHLARTLKAFDPDLAIFLSTNNDFDESLEIGTIWARARILMWIRLIDQMLFKKAERKALRRSPERIQFFADQVDRMIHFCEHHGVPLIIGFLRSKNHQDLLDHLRPDSWLATHPDGVGSDGFKLELVSLDASIRNIPDVDKHLSAPAYEVVAKLFCRQISASEQGDRCVPTGWIARRQMESSAFRVGSFPRGN